MYTMTANTSLEMISQNKLEELTSGTPWRRKIKQLMDVH